MLPGFQPTLMNLNAMQGMPRLSAPMRPVGPYPMPHPIGPVQPSGGLAMGGPPMMGPYPVGPMQPPAQPPAYGAPMMGGQAPANLLQLLQMRQPMTPSY